MKVETVYEDEVPIHAVVWTPATVIEPLHWHSCFELGYCLSGKGWFYFGDKKYEVGPGDMFVVNNIERHIAQADSENPCRFIFIFFEPTVIEKADLDFILPFLYNPKLFKNRIEASEPIASKIGMFMQLIYDEIEKKNKGYKKFVRYTLFSICSLIVRHYGSEIDNEKNHHMLNGYVKLKPALIFLEECFREPIQLKDVAEKVSLSPSRTRHLFKETLGENFNEYLLRLRINEAKRLLVYSDLSILEICFQSGFNSTATFYRSFSSFVGVSPHKFREKIFAFEYLQSTPEIQLLHFK